MSALSRLSAAATRQFSVWVILVTLAGLLWPAPFLHLLPAIKWLLGAIMFGMGMTLRFEDFARIARRPAAVGAGVCLQYLIMPLAGWVIARLLDLPPELAVGVLLVGACPGGTASNVIVFLARGDVALSVTMTAVSTLIAPLMTPLLTLWLAGRWMDVSASALMLDIAKVVLLPVLTGLLIQRYAAPTAARAQPLLPLVSVVCIALIIGAVIAANAGRVLDAGAPAFAAVVLHNLAGLGLGYAAARALRLGVQQRRAIAVEVGMQNSGLAVALATAHFSPLAALPGALFSVWHNLSGSALVSHWGKSSD